MRRAERGFTLLELVAVLALAALTLIAIQSQTAAGIRIWRALTRSSAGESDRLFGIKTSSDFRRAFRFAAIPFKGDLRSVSFASIVRGRAAVGGDRAIGEVGFEFDPGRRVLVRRERDWHDVSKDKPGKTSVILTDVKDLKITYLTFDPEYKVFGWHEAWSEDEKTLPLAVRFELERPGQTGPASVTRTFDVPTGG